MLICREEASKDESVEPRMADPVLTLGFIAFFVALSGLLGLTSVAFTRMDRDVRRARMLIMEKRIQRFLGAFTFAFIALTVLICASTIAIGLPAALGTSLLVVWLGGMGYGTYELFLIVRPPKGMLFRLVKKSNTGRSVLLEKAAILDRSGRERDAAK